MLTKFKDRLAEAWESRFQHGVAVSLGDLSINRFHNGEYIGTIHVLSLGSTGTGHWPWYVFEFGFCTGPRGSWHIGVLGLTVGKVIVNDYDQETGEIVGPDKVKYYWFFKGINHKDKQLEEIY
jgi:hypothetical protein